MMHLKHECFIQLHVLMPPTCISDWLHDVA